MDDRARELEELAVGFASAALLSALAGDWGAATAAVRSASDRCGGEGVELCIRAWCDTLVDAYRQATGTQADAPVRPVWVDPETSQVATDAAGVPPEVRWAGRVIAARAALDCDAYGALLLSIPDDDAACGAHVLTLLDSVAQTLRHLMEGPR